MPVSPSGRLFVLLLCLTLHPALDGRGQTTAPEFFQSARAKSDKRDYQGAIDDYTKSIELDPAHASSYNNRGVAKRRTGDNEGALADYNKAIELDPKYGLPYNGRGNIKSDRGDLDGALEDFNKSIEFEPKQLFAYLGRAIIRTKKGDVDGAIADYDKAIENHPKDPLGYYNRGIAKRTKGDLAGGIEDFTTTIKLSPSFSQAVSARAALYFRTQAWKEALADYRRYAKLRPGFDTTHIWIWFARMRLGEKTDAYRELAEHIAERGSNVEEWRMKSAAFLLDELSEEELHKAASDDLDTVSSREGEAWYYSGMKRLMAGDTDGAVEHLKKCLTGEKKQLTYGFADAELKALGRR